MEAPLLEVNHPLLAKSTQEAILRVPADEVSVVELPTRTELRTFVEEMASQVKTAAEGYGATLEALQRDIRRLSSKVTTKDRHRDLVSTDHGKRISALERR